MEVVNLVSQDKRTRFFGRLMPKEPTDEILVDNYHDVHRAYDQFPEQRGEIVYVDKSYATCSDGTKLTIRQ